MSALRTWCALASLRPVATRWHPGQQGQASLRQSSVEQRQVQQQQLPLGQRMVEQQQPSLQEESAPAPVPRSGPSFHGRLTSPSGVHGASGDDASAPTLAPGGWRGRHLGRTCWMRCASATSCTPRSRGCRTLTRSGRHGASSGSWLMSC